MILRGGLLRKVLEIRRGVALKLCYGNIRYFVTFFYGELQSRGLGSDVQFVLVIL